MGTCIITKTTHVIVVLNAKLPPKRIANERGLDYSSFISIEESLGLFKFLIFS